MKKILVILPSYNIEAHCDELIKKLNNTHKQFDFLFIDDKSEDNTVSILKKHNMNFLSLDKHSGKASALKKGFNEAIKEGYPFVVTMDADLQHDPNDLMKLVTEQTNTKADIVLARRHFTFKKMPFPRIISNLLTSKIISYLSNTNIPDSQCGYRLIKTTLLSIETKFSGFQFESEFLVKSLLNGAKISFVDIKTIYNHSKSSMKYIRDTYLFILLFFYLYKGKSRNG